MNRLAVYLGDGPLIADIVERSNHANVVRKDAVLAGIKFPGTDAIYVDLSKGEEESVATLAHEYRHTLPDNQALLKKSAFEGENDAYFFEEQFRIDNKLPPIYQDRDELGHVKQKTETSSSGGMTKSLTFDIASRRGERLVYDSRGNATFVGKMVPFPEVIAEIARQRTAMPPSSGHKGSTPSVPLDTINYRTKQGTNAQKIDPSFWICSP